MSKTPPSRTANPTKGPEPTRPHPPPRPTKSPTKCREDYIREVVAAAGSMTPEVAAELRRLLPPVPVPCAA
jgi:hypothetical protein